MSDVIHSHFSLLLLCCCRSLLCCCAEKLPLSAAALLLLSTPPSRPDDLSSLCCCSSAAALLCACAAAIIYKYDMNELYLSAVCCKCAATATRMSNTCLPHRNTLSFCLLASSSHHSAAALCSLDNILNSCVIVSWCDSLHFCCWHQFTYNDTIDKYTLSSEK